MEKEKIRPLYSEFQGYLSQAPAANTPNDTVGDNSLWEQYNDSIKILSEISEEDYLRFLIKPERGGVDMNFIYLSSYQQKLGGLISNLHGRYFSDESPPFSGSPSTIVSQTQQQNQSVQMLLDIQSKIDYALQNVGEDSNEKGFLKKFKSTLSTVSSVTEVFKLCLQLAKEYGIGVSILLKWFS